MNSIPEDFLRQVGTAHMLEADYYDADTIDISNFTSARTAFDPKKVVGIIVTRWANSIATSTNLATHRKFYTPQDYEFVYDYVNFRLLVQKRGAEELAKHEQFESTDVFEVYYRQSAIETIIDVWTIVDDAVDGCFIDLRCLEGGYVELKVEATTSPGADDIDFTVQSAGINAAGAFGLGQGAAVALGTVDMNVATTPLALFSLDKMYGINGDQDQFLSLEGFWIDGTGTAAAGTIVLAISVIVRKK